MINKIIQFQTKITPDFDKLAHFFWGFFYSLVGVLISEDWLILLIPFVFALYKEIKDYFSYGGFSVLDIIFTCFPSLIIYFIV